VLHMNPAAQKLYAMLGVGPGDSLLELVMSDTLPQMVENWPQVAHHACQLLLAHGKCRPGRRARP